MRDGAQRRQDYMPKLRDLFTKTTVNRFKVTILTCTEAVRALSPYFLTLRDTSLSASINKNNT